MSADRIREAYDYWSGQLRYQQARATQPRFVLDRCRRAGAMGGQTMRRKEKFTAPLGIGGACMMCRQIDADLIPVDAVTVRGEVLLCRGCLGRVYDGESSFAEIAVENGLKLTREGREFLAEQADDGGKGVLALADAIDWTPREET